VGLSAAKAIVMLGDIGIATAGVPWFRAGRLPRIAAGRSGIASSEKHMSAMGGKRTFAISK
jgi:hypothetical protein